MKEFIRQLVPLKPGEIAPDLPFSLQPPDGFRLETDDELRERIMKEIKPK
jgi:hypothetical protein